jgi:NADPH-dependent 2,4-dienoyl-CoA reductase/sulfur reductase-like enzyme/rhodanese-related sulfurtransferase
MLIKGGFNMTTKILVIGAVAAGTKAAAKARREAPDAEITVLTNDEDISYAGCGLPYFLGNVIKEKPELVVKKPEDFKDLLNITVLVKHDAKKIIPEEKKVIAVDMASEAEKTFSYDKLIIATGASPFVPPITGRELKNVFPLRRVVDAVAIREKVDKGEVKNAVIIGGGFIGLEVAENLANRGVKTTVVELQDHILPVFDKEIALLAQRHMVEKGVKMITGEGVESIEGDDEGRAAFVKTSNNRLPADIVIMSIGVRPNTQLAADAGIEIGPTRAIKVDDNMRTSVKDIYAVGDCAENVHLVTGKPVWFPMGSTANKMGRIAAIDLFDDEPSLPLKVAGTTIVKLFEMNVAKTGLTERDARKEGYDVETVLVPADDRAHYYPGHRMIITKLVVDKNTHKVLGAQIAGTGVVDKPIDIIATALYFGAKVEDLARLDLAYAPPFSMAMSSTIVAANVMINKLTDRVRGMSPVELHERLNDPDIVIIDNRPEPEHIIRTIPGAILVEPGELRQKAAKLDKAKHIVIVCRIGRRAYSTYITLKHMGFERVSILDGGVTAWPYDFA